MYKVVQRFKSATASEQQCNDEKNKVWDITHKSIVQKNVSQTLNLDDALIHCF